MRDRFGPRSTGQISRPPHRRPQRRKQMIAAISLAVLLSLHNTHSAAPIITATLASYEDSELKQGRLAYTEGNYQRAVDILKPYVEKKPKSFDGHLYLGLSYRELKRFDEAISML